MGPYAINAGGLRPLMFTNVGEGLLRLRGLLKFFFHNLASVRKAAVSIVAQVLKSSLLV